MTAAAEHEWTANQRRAIETVGVNVMVSAAAGSGKTSVLAERCAYLICDAPEPYRCDVDQLLVVTFTRSAAAEMRGRIEEALRRRAGPSADARVRRQISLIGRAEISTLHSFCSNVIRRHFDLLGIDPAFAMLDESEALLLRNNVARQVFERRYGNDSDGAFQRLIEQYAAGNDASLLSLVVRTDQMLRSVVDPDAWRQNALARLTRAADEPLATSDLGGAFLALVRSELRDVRGLAQVAAARVAPALPKHRAFAAQLLATVTEWDRSLEERGYDALVADVAAWNADAPRKPNTDGSPEATLAGRLIDAVREPVKRGWLGRICRFREAEWRDGMKTVVGPATLLLQLVDEFSDAYTRAKDALRALDFSDLERLSLAVLRDPAQPEISPGPAVRGYHERFKHVLVDEYQDINPLQDQILRLVSHECLVGEDEGEGLKDVRGGQAALPPNLFCVGDVKQSIYRFRLADPSQFLRRTESCRFGNAGVVIDLSENFRSDPPVLATINHVFSRLMTSRAAEIDYDDTHALRPGMGLDQYSPLPASVEVHLLPRPVSSGPSEADDDDDFNTIEREAAVTADLIQKMIAQPSATRWKYSDVAVLLRSIKQKAERFAAVLRSMGVPAQSDSSSGFFGTTEIRDMLALLRCLDNPRQDIPLAAVLRSPLVQLPEPDDALARIRLAYKKDVAFHDAVFRYSRQSSDDLGSRLSGFRQQLDGWRSEAASQPLAGVIWRIWEETGYLAYCSALNDGRQRVANLLYLHDRARQFGTFTKQGLRRFLDYLVSVEEEGDLGLPSAVIDPGNVVRIMSIHGSKGLEFPIVFIPDRATKFNLRDAAGPMLVDRDAMISPQVVDGPRKVRWHSLSSAVAAREIRRKSIAEELRILYVGMTRAKRKLILMASPQSDPTEAMSDWREQWANHDGPLPPEVVQGASTMLDWIGPVAMMRAPSNAPLEMIVHDEASIATIVARAGKRERNARLPDYLRNFQPLPSAPSITARAQAALDHLQWSHPLSAYSKQPAAVAVTQLTKSGRSTGAGESPSVREVVKFTPPLPLPRFLNPGRSATPTEIGTATHRVLQAIDLCCLPESEEVLRQIQKLIEKRQIFPQEARLVNVDAVAWFLASPVGRLLRDNIASVQRELPIFCPSPPAAELPPSSDPLDRVMLRGQIDVLIDTEPGLVVVDYKTDRITEQTLAERAEFYRPQIQAYCVAIAAIAGRPVVAAHMVFLELRTIVEVSVMPIPTQPRSESR